MTRHSPPHSHTDHLISPDEEITPFACIIYHQKGRLTTAEGGEETKAMTVSPHFYFLSAVTKMSREHIKKLVYISIKLCEIVAVKNKSG